MSLSFAQVEKGYAVMWASMHVRPERLAAAQTVARRVNASRARYEKVAAVVGCPWYFVGIVHNLEGGASFSTHLSNGQSLLRRTTLVPAGRPPASVGDPPFTWEVSAIDALRYQKIDRVPAWSIPRLLWEFELWNGLGYYGKINSPYVWSFSDHYVRGKYESDGHYNPSLVSQQCGAAVALRAMIDLGYIQDVKPKGDPMKELEAIVQALGRNAPLLAANIGGPLAGIAIKILADAAGAKNTEPQTVVDKLHELAGDIPGLLTVLFNAEEQMATIAPAAPQAQAPGPLPTWTTGADAPPAAVVPSPPAQQPVIVNVQQQPQQQSAPLPAPIVVAPAAPVTVGIEPAPRTGIMSFLDGYRTNTGIVVTTLGFLGYFTHYISADASNSIIAIGVAIGGWGLVNKWTKFQKVIPIIPSLPQAQIDALRAQELAAGRPV